MGCIVYDGEIPDDLEKGVVGRGFPIDVFNVLGAGDAFMAGFLRGWLRDEPLSCCCTYANGCGALVVSRHGCAPAMPSFEELQYFIEKGSKTKRVREDTDIEHLHRVTTRTRHWKELVVLAFDHRVQLEQLAGVDKSARERIERFKRLVAEGGCRAAAKITGVGVGMILDDRYGENTLPVITGRVGSSLIGVRRILHATIAALATYLPTVREMGRTPSEICTIYSLRRAATKAATPNRPKM